MMRIKVAYLLLVHKNVEQVNMFIEQLQKNGDCDIYLHIDKKAEKEFRGIAKSEKVYTCSVYDVQWGSFEIVKAALYLMRMVNESGNNYSHIYFGSGQDLMVKKGFYRYLEDKPDSIFLHIVGEIKNSDRGSARYRISWPHKLMIRDDIHPYRFIRIGMQMLCKVGIVLHKNKHVLKNRIRFYEGRTWFILPYEVMDYIVSYTSNNEDYVEFWDNSLASDIMFFQTIIMNSPFSNKVEDELMYVKFGRTFRTMNHPLDVTIKCENEINDGNFYFARKFDLELDRQSFEYYLGSINR